MIECAAFGLAVSEAETEITSLRTKGMPGSTAIFSVEAAGQVYNQTNEFVYLGGDVYHNADLHIEVNQRIRNAWCSFRKYPSDYTTNRAPPSSSNPDAQSRSTRDNPVWLRHVEPARVPLRDAEPSPPKVPDPLHRLAKEQTR